MASITAIYNLALIPLGTDRVTDPDEETQQARLCGEIYPYLRDDELSGHPWNFATTRINCALSTSTPLYDFSYAYQVPSDCLRILSIDASEDTYRKEEDKILTDVSPLYIRYIKQITDVAQFSPSFISVLAARMSYELAFILSNVSATKISLLYDAYKEKSRRAKMINAQEGSPYNLHSDRIINARQGTVR